MGVVPLMRTVREHDENVFIILPRKHGEAACDAAREERHTFVLNCTAIESEDAEVKKIQRRNEHWQDIMSVVGGIGGVIYDRSIVVGKADKTGVFDAVGLVGRDREDDTFAHGELVIEAQFVVGVSQPLDAFERVVDVARSVLGFMPDAAHAFVQVAASKTLRQWCHDSDSVPVINAHFVQLDDEKFLMVAGIGNDLWSGDKTGDGIKGNAPIRRDAASAELDGGDVPLSSRTQAHDESQASCGNATLVRVWYDRGIEDSGGFQRVFAGEQRADEQLSFARERSLREHVMPHLLVMLL